MTRRLSRFRGDRYDALSTQSLESRLCLSAVSVSSAAVTDHADDYESPEFEELEELIEEAHEYGYQFDLQDQHELELVDDVIAHVAAELLIAPSALHELVISTRNSSTDDGAATSTVSEFESESDDEGGSTQQIKQAAANPTVLIKLTGQVEEDVATEEASEAGLASDDAVIESVEGKAVSIDDGRATGAIIDGQVAIATESIEAATESSSADELVAEGSVVEASAVEAGEVVVAGLSDTTIGIRYGSAFELLAEQIRLPFSIEGASYDGVNLPARTTPTAASSTATVLLSAALAGSVLAASNAPNSPAVQKIVRKIRRSIRPAV